MALLDLIGKRRPVAPLLSSMAQGSAEGRNLEWTVTHLFWFLEVLGTIQKATNSLQRALQAPSVPISTCHHGLPPHCCCTWWWAQDRHICSLTATTPSNYSPLRYSNTTALAPHIHFQLRIQWVLLTGMSSEEEMGRRPPFKIQLPTASEIKSQWKINLFQKFSFTNTYSIPYHQHQ